MLINQLEEDEKNTLFKIINSMLTKNRRKDLLETFNVGTKKKKLSQADVGKKIGINGDANGIYERKEVRPTIEMAVKVAKTLEVSLDYLTGNSDIELYKTTLDRVQEITKLPEKDKD